MQEEDGAGADAPAPGKAVQTPPGTGKMKKPLRVRSKGQGRKRGKSKGGATGKRTDLHRWMLKLRYIRYLLSAGTVEETLDPQDLIDPNQMTKLQADLFIQFIEGALQLGVEGITKQWAGMKIFRPPGFANEIFLANMPKNRYKGKNPFYLLDMSPHS